MTTAAHSEALVLKQSTEIDRAFFNGGGIEPRRHEEHEVLIATLFVCLFSSWFLDCCFKRGEQRNKLKQSACFRAFLSLSQGISGKTRLLDDAKGVGGAVPLAFSTSCQMANFSG